MDLGNWARHTPWYRVMPGPQGALLADASIDIIPTIVQLPLRMLKPSGILLAANRVDRAHVAQVVVGVDGLGSAVVARTISENQNISHHSHINLVKFCSGEELTKPVTLLE